LSKFFYSPTDAQVNCLKNNFKFCIKIDIKTAATCFGAVGELNNFDNIKMHGMYVKSTCIV